MVIMPRIMKYIPTGQASNATRVSSEPPVAAQPPVQTNGMAIRARSGAAQQIPRFSESRQFGWLEVVRVQALPSASIAARSSARTACAIRAPRTPATNSSACAAEQKRSPKRSGASASAAMRRPQYAQCVATSDDVVVMSAPHLPGASGCFMPPWPPIIPPPPIEPIISIIRVMPSITSPLPIRRAIAIMLVMASDARGDCMNSSMAFLPSSVTPGSRIIRAHVAIGAADGVSGAFSAATATPLNISGADMSASARVIVFFIESLRLSPPVVLGHESKDRGRQTSWLWWFSRTERRSGGGRRTRSERDDRLPAHRGERRRDDNRMPLWRHHLDRSRDCNRDATGELSRRGGRLIRLAAGDLLLASGPCTGKDLMGSLYTPRYARANACVLQPRAPPEACRSACDLHEGDHAALHVHGLVAVEEPVTRIVGRELDLDRAHVGLDINRVLD